MSKKLKVVLVTRYLNSEYFYAIGVIQIEERRFYAGPFNYTETRDIKIIEDPENLIHPTMPKAVESARAIADFWRKEHFQVNRLSET